MLKEWIEEGGSVYMAACDINTTYLNNLIEWYKGIKDTP